MIHVFDNVSLKYSPLSYAGMTESASPVEKTLYSITDNDTKATPKETGSKLTYSNQNK